MSDRKGDTLVFKDFLEYWYYARIFSDKQKEIIFNSLSEDEREFLIHSCSKEKYVDVLNRNTLNQVIDDMKTEYGYDLIDIRYRVMNNKSVYVPTIFWTFVLGEFEGYEDEDINFILGGIEAIVCKQNKQVTLLVPFYSNIKD